MACKYPVILVHGLMIRHLKFSHAFGKIGRVLKEEGHSVHIATHDGFGAIETNAAQIKDFILEVMKKTGAEKVNIIAHSKGGLDVKYAIMNREIADKIASFTTLSTPHKGSALASLIWKLPTPIKKIIALFINLFYKLLGDKKPNALKACDQLREHQSEISIMVPENIYCQSYSAKMKRSRDCFVMCIPNKIYKHITKAENDGMVTPESAMFGNYRGDALDESLSHAQMVDFATVGKRRKRVFEFYKRLCSELEKTNF